MPYLKSVTKCLVPFGLFKASKCILFPLHRLNVFPVIKDVDVLYAEAKLNDPANTILTTPIDANDPGPQPIRWTNNEKT
jgi:hypothetical protein